MCKGKREEAPKVLEWLVPTMYTSLYVSPRTSSRGTVEKHNFKASHTRTLPCLGQALTPCHHHTAVVLFIPAGGNCAPSSSSTLIRACERASPPQPEVALRLVADMETAGVRPSRRESRPAVCVREPIACWSLPFSCAAPVAATRARAGRYSQGGFSI